MQQASGDDVPPNRRKHKQPPTGVTRRFPMDAPARSPLRFNQRHNHVLSALAPILAIGEADSGPRDTTNSYRLPEDTREGIRSGPCGTRSAEQKHLRYRQGSEQVFSPMKG